MHPHKQLVLIKMGYDFGLGFVAVYFIDTVRTVRNRPAGSRCACTKNNQGECKRRKCHFGTLEKFLYEVFFRSYMFFPMTGEPRHIEGRNIGFVFKSG